MTGRTPETRHTPAAGQAPPTSREPDGDAPHRSSRRRLLLAAGAAGLATAGAAGLAAGTGGTELVNVLTAGTPDQATQIPPTEDLMREHGVLKRLLLAYRAAAGRLSSGTGVPAQPVRGAAEIIQDYIHSFHEGLEEAYVFPQLRSGPLSGTVTVLLVQHARGRLLTQQIRAAATARAMGDPAARKELAAAMDAFVRMYEPHEAREDTVIFPAFRAITPPAQFSALATRFADEEERLFGSDGFAEMVGKVVAIEKALGIYELNQFTPALDQ
jgi:hemerythrin-like domain-containing protein